MVGVHPTANAIPVVDYDEPRMLALTVSIGPLCRDALDAAAIVLQAMTGPDGRDFTALPFDPPDYLANMSDGVQGMRLVWTADYGYAGMYARDILPQKRTPPRVLNAGPLTGGA